MYSFFSNSRVLFFSAFVLSLSLFSSQVTAKPDKHEHHKKGHLYDKHNKLKGKVADIDLSNQTFIVKDQAICFDEKTKFKGGDELDLAPGRFVEVKAKHDKKHKRHEKHNIDGICAEFEGIYAREIKFKKRKDDEIQYADVNGGGVKGPMAHAAVSAYEFDSLALDFRSTTFHEGQTNSEAKIIDLALPFPLQDIYIAEFSSREVVYDTDGVTILQEPTIDITTGFTPVITVLRTVITQAMLNSGEQIYATPLTTLAVDLAITNARNANTDADGIYTQVTTAQFITALADAQLSVKSTLGFGLDDTIDIFSTPPLITSSTTTTEDQQATTDYRSAVEAVTAIVYEMQQVTGDIDVDTNDILTDLGSDLSDGIIDGEVANEDGTITTLSYPDDSLQVLEQDPATLIIPNPDPTAEPITVGQIVEVLEAEQTITEPSSDPIVVTAEPELEEAETNPDYDGDGVLNAEDDYPHNPALQTFGQGTDADGDGWISILDSDSEQIGQDPDDSTDTIPSIAFVDTDGDGLADSGGANPDSDDDNDGLTDAEEEALSTNPLLKDTDGDGVYDGADDWPLDNTLTFDSDLDTIGNNLDNCAFIENFDQADFDNDFIGDVCDQDDDNDAVIDTEDNCPLMANLDQADLDGDLIGDACDEDIDGDTVLNEEDAFPTDNTETVDTDLDGVGDNSDVFPDDPTETIDSDLDGVGDNGDAFPFDEFETTDTDVDGIGDNSDLEPNDPNIGAALTFTEAELASEYVQLIDSVISNPSRYIGPSQGRRFKFDGAGQGYYSDQLEGKSLSYSFADNVLSLSREYIAVREKMSVSDLLALGVISQEAADTTTITWSIDVDVTPTPETWQLLEQGATESRFYVTTTKSYNIVSNWPRQQLLGDNAGAVEIPESSEFQLSIASSIATIAWTEEELTSNQWALPVLFDPDNESKGSDLVSFVGNGDGTGMASTQLIGEVFSWSIDSNGILQIDYQDGDENGDGNRTISIHKFETYEDSVGVLVQATRNESTISYYNLGLIAVSGASIQPLVNQFLINGGNLITPDNFNELGEMINFNGSRFEEDGRVTEIQHSEFIPTEYKNGWHYKYWSENSEQLLAIETRKENISGGWAAECDKADDQCNVATINYWKPIKQIGNRIYVLQWWESNANNSVFPSIEEDYSVPDSAYLSFYEVFDIDSDKDGIKDSLDGDDDNDGTLDIDDHWPFDARESADSDGDGVGNNTDLDDDGDGFSDSDEIAAGTDPLINSSVPADIDSDFVSDVTDNCPSIANPSQADSDNDGAGNACDSVLLKYSYTFLSGETISGAIQGLVQDDDDSVIIESFVSAYFEQTAFAKISSDELRATPSADSPTMSFSGNALDFWACPLGFTAEYLGGGDCNFRDESGFLLTHSDDIVVGGWAGAGPGDGVTKPSEVGITLANWQLVVLYPDADEDGDGTLNETDLFPLDAAEQLDSDGDGVGDNGDAFPFDEFETTDTDVDGIGDNSDLEPNDPNIGAALAFTTTELGSNYVALLDGKLTNPTRPLGLGFGNRYQFDGVSAGYQAGNSQGLNFTYSFVDNVLNIEQDNSLAIYDFSYDFMPTDGKQWTNARLFGQIEGAVDPSDPSGETIIIHRFISAIISRDGVEDYYYGAAWNNKFNSVAGDGSDSAGPARMTISGHNNNFRVCANGFTQPIEDPVVEFYDCPFSADGAGGFGWTEDFNDGAWISAADGLVGEVCDDAGCRVTNLLGADEVSGDAINGWSLSQSHIVSDYPIVSQLLEKGVISQENADAFIANNGDNQVAVAIATTSQSWQLLESTPAEDRFYATTTSSYMLVDDYQREQLLGDVNAGPVEGIISAPETLHLTHDSSITNIPWTEAELTESQWVMAASFDPDNSNGLNRISSDIISFSGNGDGTGTANNQFSSEAFNWSIDENGVLQVDYQDSLVNGNPDRTVQIAKFESYDDSHGVLIQASRDGQTLASYSLALEHDASASAQPLRNQFLMGAFSLTDPNDYNEYDEILSSSYFGFRLEDDGRTSRIWNGDFNSAEYKNGWDYWYWSEDVNNNEITLEGRWLNVDQGWNEACDKADDQCNRWRIRHWQPVKQIGDRLYVLEWEERNHNTWTFPSVEENTYITIKPRINFYQAFDIDSDGDGELDSFDLDDDNDGTLDTEDAWQFDAAEQFDTDGDGVGDNADALPNDPTETVDSDGDGVGDNSDLDPNNPLISAAQAFDASMLSNKYVSRTPSHIGEPQHKNWGNSAIHFNQDGSGAKLYDNSDSTVAFSWLINSDILEIPDIVEPLWFNTVQDLVNFGVATQAQIDSYLQANSDITDWHSVDILSSNTRYQLLNNGSEEDIFLINANAQVQLNDYALHEAIFGIGAGEQPYVVESEIHNLLDVDNALSTAFELSEFNDQSWAIRVLPGTNLQADIFNFVSDGNGSSQLSGLSFTWQVVNGSVELSFNDIDGNNTPAIITLTRFNAFAAGAEVYAEIDMNGALMADYLIAIPNTDTNDVSKYVGNFLDSETGHHNDYLENGEHILSIWGMILNEEMSVDNLNFYGSQYTGEGYQYGIQRRFWNDDNGNVIITRHLDSSGNNASDCDTANPDCVPMLKRTWVPLNTDGDRLYVLEWEELLDNRWDFPATEAEYQWSMRFAPRVTFYRMRDLYNGFDDKLANLSIRDQLGLNLDTPLTQDIIDSVTYLNFNGSEIYSLAGLEVFQNLQAIDIGNTQLTDLSPLNALPHLTEVYMDGHIITDNNLIQPLLDSGVNVHGNYVVIAPTYQERQKSNLNGPYHTAGGENYRFYGDGNGHIFNTALHTQVYFQYSWQENGFVLETNGLPNASLWVQSVNELVGVIIDQQTADNYIANHGDFGGWQEVFVESSRQSFNRAQDTNDEDTFDVLSVYRYRVADGFIHDELFGPGSGPAEAEQPWTTIHLIDTQNAQRIAVGTIELDDQQLAMIAMPGDQLSADVFQFNSDGTGATQVNGASFNWSVLPDSQIQLDFADIGDGRTAQVWLSVYEQFDKGYEVYVNAEVDGWPTATYSYAIFDDGNDDFSVYVGSYLDSETNHHDDYLENGEHGLNVWGFQLNHDGIADNFSFKGMNYTGDKFATNSLTRHWQDLGNEFEITVRFKNGEGNWANCELTDPECRVSRRRVWQPIANDGTNLWVMESENWLMNVWDNPTVEQEDWQMRILPRLTVYKVRDLYTPFADRMMNLALRNEQGLSLDALIDFEGITQLLLQDYPIYSIEGVEQFVNLTEIVLANTQVGDLSPLFNLTQLTEVNVENIPLNDPGQIDQLINLFPGITVIGTPKLFISTLTFSDTELQNCINETGAEFVEQITHLNCDYRNISDITDIYQLSSLEQINLNGNRDITDFSALALISSLNNIDAWDTNFASSDFSAFAGHGAIRRFALDSNLLTSIADASSMLNLQALHLWTGQQYDLSVLTGLANFNELALSADQVQDFNEFNQLTNIEHLWLNGDMEPWQVDIILGYSNLQQLSIAWNSYLTNELLAQFVSNNPNLSSLGLEHTQITDISAVFINGNYWEGLAIPLERINIDNLAVIDGFDLDAQIQELWNLGVQVDGELAYGWMIQDALNNIDDPELKQCLIDHTQGMQVTGQLHELWCGGRNIHNVWGLWVFDNLRQLDLSNNPIMDLGGELDSMQYLEQLHIQDTLINDISMLGNLPSLTYVNINNLLLNDPNQANNLPGQVQVDGNLQAQVELNSLFFNDPELNQCVIDHSGGLTYVSELTHLNCDGRPVSNIDDIWQLAALYSIRLSYTQVSDLDPLYNLPSLTEVFVNGLGLTNAHVAEVAGIPRLEYLDISDNDAIDDLWPLAGVSQLTGVQLWGNNQLDLTPLTQLPIFNNIAMNTSQLANDISIFTQMPMLRSLFFNGELSYSDFELLMTSLNLNNIGQGWNSQFDQSFLQLIADNQTNLHGLSINGNSVSDISLAINFMQLHWLSLDQTQVSDLQPLIDLRNAQDILYQNDDWKPVLNNVSIDLAPISDTNQITTLQNLGVQVDGEIGTGVPIAGLTFTDANFAQCVSEQTQGMSLTGQVTHLGCSHRSITNIGGVEAFESLISLDVNENQISDLTVLSSITSLQELHIMGEDAYNIDLTPLTSLLNFTTLAIRRNQLDNFNGEDNFDQIALLTHLTSLTVHGDISSSVDMEVNGDFETGDLSGWNTFGGTHLVEVPSFNAQEGDYAVKLTNPDGSGVAIIKQEFAANPGDEFYLSGYMRSEAIRSDGAEFGLLKISFWDDNNSLTPLAISKGVGNDDFPGVESLPWIDENSPVGEWIFSEAQGVAPPGTVKVTFELTNVNFVNIEKPIWFDNIKITSKPISDMDILLGLTNLERLDLGWGGGLGDSEFLSLLTAHTGIKHLSFQAVPITDLMPVDQLLGLESLNIQRTNITDLSPLFINFDINQGPVENLNYLNIEGLAVVNGSDIEAQVQALVDAGVQVDGELAYGWMIQDALNNIDDPELKQCLIDHTQGMQVTGQLHELWCGGRNIHNVRGLWVFDNLRQLDLSGNPIMELGGELDSMHSLHTLYIGDTLINDISMLGNLPSLTYVNINNLLLNDSNQANNLPEQVQVDGNLQVQVELNSLFFNDPELNQCVIDHSGGLTYVSELTHLNCDGRLVSNIDDIWQLAALHSIRLSYTQVSDLDPLYNLPSLTEVFINGLGLTNAHVAEVAGIPRLEYLDISDNDAIDDLWPLAGVSQLTGVQLWGNNQLDLTPLTQLPVFDNIAMNTSQLANDISIFTQMPMLRSLFFNGELSYSDFELLMTSLNLNNIGQGWNSQFDHSFLQLIADNQTNLHGLSIDGNSVSDISLASNFMQLHWLSLNQTQVSDLQPLIDLRNAQDILYENDDWKPVLNNINIELAPISDTNQITTLQNLGVQVDGTPLTGGLIADLTFIDAELQACVIEQAQNQGVIGVEQLGDLNCSGRAITDISDLDQLTHLYSVNFNDINSIADFSALERIYSLQNIDVWNSSFSDIDFARFADYTNISHFGLGHAQVTTIADAASMPNLQSLHLWGDETKVYDLSVLTELANFNTLALSANQVLDVSIIPQLAHLQWLWLNGDMPIDDVNEILNLSNLKHLELGYNSYLTNELLAQFINNNSNLDSLGIPHTQITDLSALFVDGDFNNNLVIPLSYIGIDNLAAIVGGDLEAQVQALINLGVNVDGNLAY